MFWQSNFRIKVEERVDTVAQLRFDLLARAFDDMHRHLRFVAVLERNRRGADAGHLIGRKQPHSIDQHQICHGTMLLRDLRMATLNPLPSKYNQSSMSDQNTVRDTVILGSGCSGLTAAIYAARSNL